MSCLIASLRQHEATQAFCSLRSDCACTLMGAKRGSSGSEGWLHMEAAAPPPACVHATPCSTCRRACRRGPR